MVRLNVYAQISVVKVPRVMKFCVYVLEHISHR